VSKLRALRKEGRSILENAGVGAPDYEADEILFSVFSMDLTGYALRADSEADGVKEEEFLRLVKERCSGRPLQYVLRKAPFMGLDFYVDERTLIPRYDTEILVEEAAGALKEDSEILDLCTGSGCVLISLLVRAKELYPNGSFRGTGVDISSGALRAAAKNAAAYFPEAELLEGDLYAPVSGRYDIITANPPYIESDAVEGLDEEVKDYEPRLALDGGADGLSFYRRIAAGAAERLKEGGRIFLEIGCTQAAEVSGLLEEAGLCGVRVARDLAGRDRVVSAAKKEI